MRIASGEVQLASGESSRITTRHTSSRGAIPAGWPEPGGGACGWCTLASWCGFGVDAMTLATTTGTGVGQWAARVFETRACSMLDAVWGKALATTVWC